jgi:hypothetical protein
MTRSVFDSLFETRYAKVTMAHYVARRKGPQAGTEWHREVADVPPIMVVHHGGTLPGDPLAAMVNVAWRMPIDDFTTSSFQWLAMKPVLKVVEDALAPAGKK